MTLQSSGSITMGDINVELGNASTDLISLNDSRVRELAEKDGIRMRYLNNPDAGSPSTGDYFGFSAAISGDYVIVGSPNDIVSGYGLGTAYIYNVTTGRLVHVLYNPETDTNVNEFGWSVSIDGNYAIVGGRSYSGSPPTTSGRAYIYNVTTGALVHTLDNPNAYGSIISDYFGDSVAISGNYAIVGAYREDDVGGTDSGKAYIYNVTTGALLFTLNNPNAYGNSTLDYFGNAVAISGNYAIVGASFEDDAGGTSSGKAYIFNVTTGALVHTLNNPNPFFTSAFDYFGDAVAISGNYAIVGANGEDETGRLSSGKAYIFNVTTGALVHTLNNPNGYGTSDNDYFGWSVAISGNYAIVGAVFEDDASGNSSGKAYIYNVTTGALIYTLDNPNAYSTSTNDYFSRVLAISGSIAVVTAWGEDDPSGTDSGKVYIFNQIGSDLTDTISLSDFYGKSGIYMKQVLDNPNAYGTSASDNFGFSVSVSGDYAIVGAPYEDDSGGSESGKAYIYNVTTGALVHTLNNPNAYGIPTEDGFGDSVAISGNYTIVGAPYEDDAFGNQSGKAYIYNVTTGALVHTLNNPNAYGISSSGDVFAYSVAISGNYAIVGAWGEGDAGGADSGKAYIYNVTTGALLFTLDNPNAYGASDLDYFGASVGISGNYAIVGARGENDAGGLNSGKAYIFNVTTGALLFTLNNPNAYGASAYDLFGESVAISGNYAIVGAYYEDDAGGAQSGKAYIFDATTGVLVHTIDNPNAYGTSGGDEFGSSVAISGNYAIVSSYVEYEAGAIQSGKAYIYNVSTGALVHTLNNPNAYGTSSFDWFGGSVAISGNYAIVGAYLEDDASGNSSGKAYVYKII